MNDWTRTKLGATCVRQTLASLSAVLGERLQLWRPIAAERLLASAQAERKHAEHSRMLRKDVRRAMAIDEWLRTNQPVSSSLAPVSENAARRIARKSSLPRAVAPPVAWFDRRSPLLLWSSRETEAIRTTASRGAHREGPRLATRYFASPAITTGDRPERAGAGSSGDELLRTRASLDFRDLEQH